ncbi:hypothetical protein RCL1_003014 [Eukaryota sp. TZLM3-RCL]
MSERSSVVTSSLSLANSILGAGIVGLAYALSHLGLIGGAIVFLFVYYFSFSSLGYLTRAAIAQRKYTFRGLVEDLFGPFAGVMVSVFVGLFSFGFLTAYIYLLIHISTSMFPIEKIGLNQNTLGIIFAVLILFPLCLLRSLHALRYASASTILIIALLTVTVIYEAFTLPIQRPPLKLFVFDSHTPAVTGTLGFAYACHYLALNVFRQMVPEEQNRKGIFIN